MQLILIASIFFIILRLGSSRIYLSHTEDREKIDLYDCVTVDSLSYCRRPKFSTDLIRTQHLHSCDRRHAGVGHFFSDLTAMDVSVSTILHQWRSSLDQVEHYARYRNGETDVNGYLCQCRNEYSFGKYCEYRLPMGTTLHKTLEWQSMTRANDSATEEIQIYGNITCYEGLSCDTGALCLDWREICDGIQNCMSAVDEELCDLLDWHRCDNDEYRCMNGMCIPDVYFLDGELDCLDWSDELNIKSSDDCADETASTTCDDHICRWKQWSCGDGQCIEDRFAFQRSNEAKTCLSRRDQAFMCETNHLKSRWTLPNGRCIDNPNNKTSPLRNPTDEEECEYYLKCFLSLGRERRCSCSMSSDRCVQLLHQHCRRPLIEYPRRGYPAPYLSFFFNITESMISRRPNLVLINGTIRCNDSLISTTQWISFTNFSNVRQVVEEFVCEQRQPIDWSQICLSHPHPSAGQNLTLMRHHRFRCSQEPETCFSILALGDGVADCSNEYDEFWRGKGRKLSDIRCNPQWKDECALLRHYMDQSWSTEQSPDRPAGSQIPFRSYCDTFWNFDSTHDEDIELCRRWWTCPREQWQCQSGQCIDHEWVNDGEWDCADGSDEGKSLGNSSMFLCLSPETRYRQIRSLNQSQIGDSKIDCLGGIDERNRLSHCSNRSSMLGANFLCSSRNTCIPYYLHCREGYRCSNPFDDQHWCSWLNGASRCLPQNDFVCFDGQLVRGGRCNRTSECSFGEDEYMCDYRSYDKREVVVYRERKKLSRSRRSHQISLPIFPVSKKTTQSVRSTRTSGLPSGTPPITFLTPFLCNRGIAVLSSNHSVFCFCPPQYYGEFCQYHADRLLVLLHLNLSQSSYTSQTKVSLVIKLLVLFLFEDQVLMTHEFHVRPATERDTVVKKMVHFPYSRSSEFRQHRLQRHANRSDVLYSYPYSIRIEAYEWNGEQDGLALIAVWLYPIYFDYFPVFRWAKVLHLIRSQANDQDPCLSNPCPSPNSHCHSLMNNRSEYVCLCKANLTGENCSIRDPSCFLDYCARSALCKPDYRRLLRGNSTPFCLCPPNRFGDRCHLEHDYCQYTSCLNGGSCFPASQPDQVYCVCTSEYWGPRCESRKPHIGLSVIEKMDYRAAVIQYFDIDSMSLHLRLVHQQVVANLPSRIDQYYHQKTTVPESVVAKMYPFDQRSAADLYLLSLHTNVSLVEDDTEISDINRCHHIRTLLRNASDSSMFSPIYYHQICINNPQFVCFHDDDYLCICAENHTRVECFLYDHHLDRCEMCLGTGRCLHGDREDPNDFLCLCPSCYSGRRCQFCSKFFTFTLDQLLYTDLMSGHRWKTRVLLIVFSLLTLIVAIPNTHFSLVTFKRSSCRINGTGYHLLCLSIINLCTIVCLAARLIFTLSIDSFHLTSHQIFCKGFNYALTCSARISFWFSALVAIERACTALSLKRPRISHCFITSMAVFVLLATSHELVFVRSFSDNEQGTGTICVIEFPSNHQTLWTIIHQIVSICHFLTPLLINVVSASAITLMLIRSKIHLLLDKKTAKTHPPQQTLHERIHENGELIARPAITLIPSMFSLFSLPLVVMTLAFDCRNLEQHPLRYLLLTFYFFTFIPSMITFLLYVYPSSFYWKEWQATSIAQHLRHWRFWSQPRRQ